MFERVALCVCVCVFKSCCCYMLVRLRLIAWSVQPEATEAKKRRETSWANQFPPLRPFTSEEVDLEVGSGNRGNGLRFLGRMLKRSANGEVTGGGVIITGQ